MHNFLSFIKEFHIPKKQELKDAVASFSKNQFWIFVASVLIAFVATICMLAKINNAFMTDVATEGGTITEGIIGTPSLVNPVLALTDADKDLTSIIYSGLMRKSPDGTFIPDLADSYTVSPDGLVYTFTLKNNIYFQDNVPVTADDVVYTINTIKDPLIKSPRKAGWDGITVTKKDDSTVVFTLSKPYISFMNNTTIGILPQHLWSKVSPPEFSLSTLNIKAVGSGPYEITSILKDSEGIPEEYKLTRFTNFTLGTPHVKYFNIISFSNEKDLINALLSHSVDQAGGISPENAELLSEHSYNISTSTLPRIFGLFWNSANNTIFADQSVVNAFNIALDRQDIIDQVLSGYGTAIHEPVPNTLVNDSDSTFTDGQVDAANALLDKAGWTLGSDGVRTKGGVPTTITKKVTDKKTKKVTTETVTVPASGPKVRLEFSLTTGNTPELKHTSELIQEELAKIGAQVDVKVYETGPLNQIIRSRGYEALFFGQVINNESDLYAFWHSSQRTDPGLNIALYNNKTVDTLLQSAQTTPLYSDRINKYKAFIDQFNKDIPAILIYSPKYLYATPKNFDHVPLGMITVPSDRFSSMYTWYASKEHVWKIFAQ